MEYKINKNDIIIFKYYCDILNDYDLMDGNIIYANKDDFSICYLEGYKSSNIDLNIKDIIAIVDKDKKQENYKHLYINDDMRFTGYFHKLKENDKIIFMKSSN
jgi:hypothetical protein